MSKSPLAQSSERIVTLALGRFSALPRRSGSALGDNRLGNLEDARNSILSDIMKIPIAPLDKLLNSLSPPINESIIDSDLCTRGKLHGRCFSLFQTAPTDYADKEVDVFRPLELLYLDIMSSPIADSRSVKYRR
jgi:hypothetical protein